MHCVVRLQGCYTHINLRQVCVDLSVTFATFQQLLGLHYYQCSNDLTNSVMPGQEHEHYIASFLSTAETSLGILKTGSVRPSIRPFVHIMVR